jgi:hypothetical protein
MDAAVSSQPRRKFGRLMLAFIALFLLPAMASAALIAYRGGPKSWRDYDGSARSSLPAAAAHPEARVLVMAGRTRGWKGAVALHSWIVIKPANATTWRRYDVVGWGGSPLRTNYWGPDIWFGEQPEVVLDLAGAAAEALIPRIEAAIKDYHYVSDGDYRMWPGPNSNTFIAAVLRAVPELGAILPSNAIGRDYRPLPYVGFTDSGTGIEASLWGVLGIKLGWIEGVELNVLGLVAGLDLRRPGIKLPGFGTLGLAGRTATAAARPTN